MIPFTMVRMEGTSPPGVSSRMMMSAAPLFSASSRPRMRNAAAPGLMGPSRSIMATSPPLLNPTVFPKATRARHSIPTMISFLFIFSHLETQPSHDLLHVLPHGLFKLALFRGIPEEVRRVKRCHERSFHEGEPVPSLLGNLEFPSEQTLRGNAAQGADHFGLDDPELLFQERKTRLDFLTFRVPVMGRPAFDHITNINIFPLEAHAAFNDLCQKLTRFADKRSSRCIFFRAGPLAHKHEAGP